ncbi:efflux RND transporter permease subunit [Methylococcus geothermalis]|uniref:Efflux pump membrane transporter n=1 Tax=Methylococcus geothermalis TaxID=2681310 RepID=A0A858Q8P7_9GAMM|nr:multidrug efflux RND transporter permease subunit [Methylococcus geothermalis]QJD30076.1 multidrug efflux RND transporter permease subunit [Methylococcus geothermalis]
MNFAHFFIDRPRFAIVLSVITVLIGGISMFALPIAQYPEVVPPTIVVSATYPGANPKVIAETVAAPIEQEVNGVEHMLYMSSQSTSDGQMQLTITFEIGTDMDIAQMQVQNRVSNAAPKLPEDVRRQAVTTKKSSPDILLVIHLVSPNRRYDQLYLSNYALLNIRDQLLRLPGVGDVRTFGAGDYSMRVWLDPARISALNMTAGDVVRAIREQNIQVPAGVIGQPPLDGSPDFQLNVNTMGRLTSVEQFGAIIVKYGEGGSLVRLRDVARIELGANRYSMRSQLSNEDAVAIPISLRPGANALDTAKQVKGMMQTLKKRFPEGVDYRIVYDTTIFVEQSLDAVTRTFFEALALVVLVVLVFLQTWRAAIIPLLAVPVSIVGTFAVMAALGYSLNNLSLFGLVLAIGIVVDDAIVVVENVERHIGLGLSVKAAARQAMREVTGPIIAISVVLGAVFIPAAFVSGINGQFYRQFAVTIAASTLISAFNSMTLSPALAAVLLQPHHAREDRLSLWIDRLFGWLFRGFNRGFDASSNGYAGLVKRLLRMSGVVLALYAGLLAFTGFEFQRVPSGFIPLQDKGYLVVFAQLPEAASLERTDAVLHRASEIILAQPGVQGTVAFPGFSVVSGANTSNAGTIFVPLKPFEERVAKGLSAQRILGELQPKLGGVKDAFIGIFPPPPILGLGSLGGFKLQIQDRGNEGFDALDGALQAVLNAGRQTPGLMGLFTSFQNDVPQLYADIDRVKAKSQGIPLSEIFDTMQIYLGSLYVNDLNLFGRTFQVTAQADGEYRREPEDIGRLKTRNAAGDMVPLEALMAVREISGPDRVLRYNMYPAAEINGSPAAGVSSGQAVALMEELVRRTIPLSMDFEWTELTYQQILAGDTAAYVFALSSLLVFLVLVALYESWILPLAIVLIVPMTLMCALGGVWLRSGDNNIFTQIALLVLVGLAAKNAILIVEFAKARREEGVDALAAALEACRLRFRPILMTSFAFIMGVLPLMFATGAGAEMRQALGVPVFFGMLGVTVFGLLFTPVFYYVLQRIADRSHGRAAQAVGGED